MWQALPVPIPSWQVRLKTKQVSVARHTPPLAQKHFAIPSWTSLRVALLSFPPACDGYRSTADWCHGLVISGALLAVGNHARRHQWRARLRGSVVRCASSDDSTDADEDIGVLSAEGVENAWKQAQALGRSAEEIAKTCALLSCVQRQLGYFAALHEGSVGSGSVISRAPALPLVLTWEGVGELEEVFGMSLAPSGTSSLLQSLLSCVKQTHVDQRYGSPGEDTQLQAKVSLLRDFADISAEPSNWSPGLHGLWYCGPGENVESAKQVYLPDVVHSVAGGESGMKGISRVLRALALWQDRGKDEDVTAPFPSGHTLYRFEAVHGTCLVANLPTMKTRMVSQMHEKLNLLAQAQIRPIADVESIEVEKPDQDDARVQFAALTARSEGTRVCAFIVPSTGTYTGAQVSFREGLSRETFTGLDKVRRIFVLAPVCDCYIDGCGLPERRCAWYGSVPLDLVVLEKLRSSKAFTELTVEQDMTERAIEVLMPLVDNCLDVEQDFTLVPVLVGGLMSRNAEQYTKLLAPYLADSANLFVVAGDAEELGDSIDLDRGMDPSDSPRRWMKEMPTLVGNSDELAPVFDALELFLAVLAQAPRREEFTFNRYW